MQKYLVVDGLGAAATTENAARGWMSGGVNAVNWTVAGHGSTAKEAAMNMVARDWLVKRLPDRVIVATSVADIEQARRDGKLAVVQGWQGAEALEDDYHWLEVFYKLGLRILQFTYNDENRLGYGCLEPNDPGLKRYGIDILQDCNRLGILVDCSHVGERTSLDTIEMSSTPCIFSHSNPKGVRSNPRNISDEQIRSCASRGGVIGATCFSDFVADTSDCRRPTVMDWVRHVDYLVDLAGIDHVGIGTDILANPGGAIWWDNNTGRQYRDISGGMTYEMHSIEGFDHSHANFPLLVGALVEQGYKEQDVARIIGGNWLRVYREAWDS